MIEEDKKCFTFFAIVITIKEKQLKKEVIQMAKFDYKKITLKEMVDWVTENEEKLAKEKKDLLVSFLSIALGEKDKKQTLQAKKPFYDLAKDYVEFENAPNKKDKKEDETVKSLKALREKYGI